MGLTIKWNTSRLYIFQRTYWEIFDDFDFADFGELTKVGKAASNQIEINQCWFFCSVFILDRPALLRQPQSKASLNQQMALLHCHYLKPFRRMAIVLVQDI